MAADPVKIVKRLDELKTIRNRHESVWRECFDHTWPLRSDGFQGERMDAVSGQARRASIVDSTGTEAAGVLAASIVGGVTPASSMWAGIEVSDETDEERRWLERAGEIVWKNIHGANFDSVALECVTDLVGAGWFAQFVDAPEDGGYHFDQWPISQVFCSSSKPGGRVDTVYRSFQLSASQAISEYGGDQVSQEIRRTADSKPDDAYEFVHAIYPRQISATGAVLARNMPVASCISEVKNRHIIEESGYHEMPVVVPRWMLIPGAPYGVGPVYDALPDIKRLNELCRMELAAADVAVGGMWIAEDDGVLNPATLKIGPRKIVPANSVDSMKPLVSGSDFNVAFTIGDQIRAQIKRIMMADQLPPVDGPARTATEFHVRIQMIRQILGPKYGRLQSEWLQGLIERCFGIALRAGVLGRPPSSLLQRNYSVRYLNPQAKAQQLENVTAIERVYADAGAIAQAKGSATVFDNLDDDEAIRVICDALGGLDKVIRPKDDVLKLRAMRAEAEQAQAEAEQAQALTGMAAQSAIKGIEKAA